MPRPYVHPENVEIVHRPLATALPFRVSVYGSDVAGFLNFQEAARYANDQIGLRMPEDAEAGAWVRAMERDMTGCRFWIFETAR